MMKRPAKRNLTVSLPADLIRDAKVIAAKRGTSLNAIVRESLERAVERDEEYSAALGRILAASKKGLYKIGSASGLRSELYGQ